VSGVFSINGFGARHLLGALLGVGVFSLCLIGILTRPHFDLATFWPANAFMLGLLVRYPSLSTTTAWVSCALGFFMADAVTGSSIQANLILNAGNVIAVGVGYSLFSRMSENDRRLKSPESILYFLGVVFAASLVSGLNGVYANPLVFGGSSFEGFVLWMATEAVNYTAFLPMFLTVPSPSRLRLRRLRFRLRRADAWKVMPLVALAVSAMAGALVGGPGAVAFPVPALLWCALTYSLFFTACLAFAFGAWTLLAIGMGIMPMGDEQVSRSVLISTRFGVTLIALAPLVVASVMAARNDLMEQLRRLAERDALTGLRNRRAFFETGAETLSRSVARGKPAAVLMIDIDHFKSVNDNFGHISGDRVITAVAEMIEKSVRSQDVVGRLGGEEFAVILPDCAADEARQVAERITSTLRSTRIALGADKSIAVTASIGLHVENEDNYIERSLARADKALYRAKNRGRDRFEFLEDAPAFAG
jgi:diguanylate cyclase (GGDEF)-like protein